MKFFSLSSQSCRCFYPQTRRFKVNFTSHQKIRIVYSSFDWILKFLFYKINHQYKILNFSMFYVQKRYNVNNINANTNWSSLERPKTFQLNTCRHFKTVLFICVYVRREYIFFRTYSLVKGANSERVSASKYFIYPWCRSNWSLKRNNRKHYKKFCFSSVLT